MFTECGLLAITARKPHKDRTAWRDCYFLKQFCWFQCKAVCGRLYFVRCECCLMRVDRTRLTCSIIDTCIDFVRCAVYLRKFSRLFCILVRVSSHLLFLKPKFILPDALSHASLCLNSCIPMSKRLSRQDSLAVSV